MIDESFYPKFVLDKLKEVSSSDDEYEDLCYQWDERCGIRHFDGNQPMKDAEKDALNEILARRERERKKQQ